MIHELNDYELVGMAQEYHEEAIEIIFDKYRSFIRKKCLRYQGILNGIGLELSDIIQECFMGLYDAILNYNDYEDVCFFTFASRCINNKLVSTIRKFQNGKNQVLNCSVRFDEIVNEEDEFTYADYFESDVKNPLDMMVDEEEYGYIYSQLIDCLSAFEECVLHLRLFHFNYCEIASILDKDEKSVDNAVQRIKFKLKNISVS